MNIKIPSKYNFVVDQARQVALNVFRPISRYYDKHEHEYPKELDMLASLLDGFNAVSNESAGASTVSKAGAATAGKVNNGANLTTLLGAIEMCYGDTGLLLTMPRQGLGNAAIAAVASNEQKAYFSNKWVAMAITEPGTGSDSANIQTTAKLDGDAYVLNGEKIYVTSGERADAVVVWATLDRSVGKAAIKSFVVEKGTPGMEMVRLEHKLGIKASDTAAFVFDNCRIPVANLLGDPNINTDKGFGGVMETFDNTRPLVAGMALGVSRASLEKIKELLQHNNKQLQVAKHKRSYMEAEIIRLEAEWEGAYWLTLKAAWMADNKIPNSKYASMAKAKAGRVASEITLKAVELAGAVGYGEEQLLEKWARDSKILDIFEGTQQIQQLIVARQVLGLNSAKLK